MNKNEIEKLIYYLSKLPGIGGRSARRIVLHLMKNKETLMLPLNDALTQAAEKIKTCEQCGNIDVNSPCGICLTESRDKTTLCVVETVAELWAFERSGFYKGIYHVLGGSLSSYHKTGPKDLNIDLIVSKAEQGKYKEIIIATNATLEGQTTAFYITEKLDKLPIKVTRLAYGMPVGGELDYLDDGTLNAAFNSRKSIDDKLS